MIEGNFIGTDPSGTIDLGNDLYGVYIGDDDNKVGGTAAGARNVIAGNEVDGVVISGTANKVTGNYVGTDAAGTGVLGNDGDGVYVFGSDHTVGGTTVGARNVIAGNEADGVSVVSGAGNRISFNSISSNGGLGIDLLGPGESPTGHWSGATNTPTANDPQDPDVGPNDLQNKPAVTSATTTAIAGRLNSTRNTTFTIQLFANPSGDEGETFIGQTSVTTNANGNAAFTLVPSRAVAEGQTVTATATGPSGSTSEFSVPATVREEIPPRVTRVGPAEGATGVAPAANVSAVFSEAMRRTSINPNTFRLRKVGDPANVEATVTYSPPTSTTPAKATLNPDASLKLGATYVATVSGGARDLAGNALDQDPSVAGNQPKTWRFIVRK